MDFSTAAPQQDYGLVPDGTLAFAILNIRPFAPPNAPPGHVDYETPSNATPGNKYLDCELTICEGPFTKRKIFSRISTVAANQTAVDIGRSAIRSILEVGRAAGAQNMGGYQIAHYGELSGLKVAIEVKVEKGSVKNAQTQERYPDKNDVRAFITPNHESSTSKKFGKLLEMAKAGYPREMMAAQPASAPTAAPAWAQPAAPAPAQAPATQPSASAKPAWLNS